jgi:hypothetical protein
MRTAKRKAAPRSKASAQYLHAKKRALERYGLELNKDSYRGLCKMIQDNQGRCLGKQSLRLSVWALDLDVGSEIITCNVVYDKERHTIVTFLPPGITDAKGVKIEDENNEA